MSLEGGLTNEEITVEAVLGLVVIAIAFAACNRVSAASVQRDPRVARRMASLRPPAVSRHGARGGCDRARPDWGFETVADLPDFQSHPLRPCTSWRCRPSIGLCVHT